MATSDFATRQSGQWRHLLWAPKPASFTQKGLDRTAPHPMKRRWTDGGRNGLSSSTRPPGCLQPNTPSSIIMQSTQFYHATGGDDIGRCRPPSSIRTRQRDACPKLSASEGRRCAIRTLDEHASHFCAIRTLDGHAKQLLRIGSYPSSGSTGLGILLADGTDAERGPV